MIDYAVHPQKWEWAPYFSVKEFTCKGSGKCLMDPDFMQRLFELREAFARPMVITSGYRSPEHNRSVSGTGSNGVHTQGKACDIAIYGANARELIGLAIQHGFTGIGISQKGADFKKRFVHIDTGIVNPRPWVWSY